MDRSLGCGRHAGPIRAAFILILPLALARTVPSTRHCRDLEDGEDRGIKPLPASVRLGPAVPGAGSEVSCVGRKHALPPFGALLLPLPPPPPSWMGSLGLGREAPCSLGAWTAASPSPHLSRPDSVSFVNASLPFFLPRVPKGLVSSLRESERHLHTCLAVSRVFFCPAQL